MAPICEKWKILSIPSPAKENPKRTMWKERGAGSGRVGANPQNSANTSVQHIIRWHDKQKTEVDIKLVTLLDCVSHCRGHANLSNAPPDHQHKQETTSLKTNSFFVSLVFQKTSSYFETSIAQCARTNTQRRTMTWHIPIHRKCLKTSSYFETSNAQCATLRHATQDKNLTRTMIPKGVSTNAQGAGRA